VLKEYKENVNPNIRLTSLLGQKSMQSWHRGRQIKRGFTTEHRISGMPCRERDPPTITFEAFPLFPLLEMWLCLSAIHLHWLCVCVCVRLCVRLWSCPAVSSMSNVLLSPWRGPNDEINQSAIEQPEKQTSDALNVSCCHGNTGCRFSTSLAAISLQAFFKWFPREAIERWEGKLVKCPKR